jgi:hypothetical protein
MRKTLHPTWDEQTLNGWAQLGRYGGMLAYATQNTVVVENFD